eukprot:754755-Hanusia_phi.AAC.5
MADRARAQHPEERLLERGEKVSQGLKSQRLAQDVVIDPEKLQSLTARAEKLEAELKILTSK